MDQTPDDTTQHTLTYNPDRYTAILVDRITPGIYLAHSDGSATVLNDRGWPGELLPHLSDLEKQLTVTRLRYWADQIEKNIGGQP